MRPPAWRIASNATRALFTVLALAGTTSAQTLHFLAPEIQDAWVGLDGTIYAQHGRRVTAVTGAVAKLGAITLDPATRLFDTPPLIELGPDSARTGGRTLPLEDRPAFSRNTGAPPVRTHLALSPQVTLLPSRHQLRVLRDAGAPPLDLPSAVFGDADLGYGAGDAMLVREIIPFALPRRSQDGLVLDLVTGIGDRFSITSLESGAARAIKPPPVDDIDGILDFPHQIEPLIADLDGQEGEDLLLADPSAGAVFLYFELKDPEPKPTRVILVGGHLVAAWALDHNGDSKRDLILLKMPKATLLSKLRIFEEKKLRVEALLYQASATGELPKSPTSTLKLDLPVGLTVRNQLREVSFPSLLAPVPGRGLLTISPEGEPLFHPFSDAPPTLLPRLPPGRPHRAFMILMPPIGPPALLWHTLTDSRVYLF